MRDTLRLSRPCSSILDSPKQLSKHRSDQPSNVLDKFPLYFAPGPVWGFLPERKLLHKASTARLLIKFDAEHFLISHQEAVKKDCARFLVPGNCDWKITEMCRALTVSSVISGAEKLHQHATNAQISLIECGGCRALPLISGHGSKMERVGNYWNAGIKSRFFPIDWFG